MNLIVGGIGKLVDGILGDDTSSWLSWNKSPVSLVFDFDVLRHFQSIQIYTMGEKYQSITVKFDDHRSIEHEISPMKTSSSNVFMDTIQLINYENLLVIGKRVEILFQFPHELLLLTEVTFDNEPAIFNHTTSTINNTTNCPIGKRKTNQGHACLLKLLFIQSSIPILPPLPMNHRPFH